MTLARWEPTEISTVMDRMFNRFFDDWRGMRPFEGPRALALDVYETEDEVICKAAVPGFSEDEVETTVEGGQLTIRARKPAESAGTENARWIAHEIWQGEFVRSLTLPAGLDPDKAEASLDHGILTVKVPKTPAARPKQIKLGVKAGKHDR